MCLDKVVVVGLVRVWIEKKVYVCSRVVDWIGCGGGVGGEVPLGSLGRGLRGLEMSVKQSKKQITTRSLLGEM